MEFKFPPAEWTHRMSDDGFNLNTPYVGLYYTPFGDDTWWYGFVGEQTGRRSSRMTEDALRVMLYTRACSMIEQEHECKAARVAQIEKLYGTS